MDITKVTKLARRALPLGWCGAVIVAAGTASRMGGIDKVMAELKGQPMIVHTVRAFEDCEAVKEIVIVTRADLVEPIRALCAGMEKVKAVVVGGKSRQESVSKGLDALSEQVQLAAVQDGARPLVTWQLIDRVVRAAHRYSAAIPAIPVKDTIKIAPSGVVESTPERGKLRAVQTPQVFDLELLRAALTHAAQVGAEVTDDCSAVELLGAAVKVVEGDERNMKVTTPLDLKLAELLMEDAT